MALSVVLITYNEEANLRRTLQSAMPLVCPNGQWTGEIIVVDNRSTDRTLEIAREFGAKVFVEEWKGFAAQKNSAIAKASGDWVLSLDADEALSPELASEITYVIGGREPLDGYTVPRRNLFLGRWIKRAGFWPDRKLRLFRRGKGQFIERPVHEVMQVDGPTGKLQHALIHNAYPSLTGYIATMNKYSSLGAELAVSKGRGKFSLVDIALRPIATFISMYLVRGGFLDGREGLLLCLYHSVYVSWKYAKAWELSHSGSPNS